MDNICAVHRDVGSWKQLKTLRRMLCDFWMMSEGALGGKRDLKYKNLAKLADEYWDAADE